jgi:PAS domain S-box-containing protein
MAAEKTTPPDRQPGPDAPTPEEGPFGGMGGDGAAQDRMLGSLVRIMQEGLLTVDLQFRVTYWSPGAQRLLGWTEADLLGKPLFDFTRPQPGAPGIEIFKRRVMSGELVTETGPRRRKDGSIAVLESSYTVLHDADGAPSGMLAVARDVTEAVAAEEALELQARRLAESEARLARVLSGSMDGFFDLDLAAGASAFSDRVAQMLGRAPQEGPTSAAEFGALLHPDDAAAFAADVARAHTGAQDAALRDVRARHADGSWRWLRIRARVTGGAGGQARHFSGTVSDVTEQRQAELRLGAELQRNEALVRELKEALEHVRTLKGLLPICVHCHKIRDDQGYWDRIEKYIGDRTDAAFSHSLCPDCLEKHYPVES